MSVFNGARFLRESVDSILRQSFRDLEFIVVNDGSTDETPAVLRAIAEEDMRVRLLLNDRWLGVHGYDHGNRTPFADVEERRRRLDGARDFLTRYQARGYRAPSLLRTRALLRDVASRYAYDSSIPTSGGPFPVPNNGCASARPFRLEGLVEIPLTLPRDGSLLFLGCPPRKILELWTQCAEAISESGGVVVLLTHCERRFTGNRAMLAVYREFLGYISASKQYAWRFPEEVVSSKPHRPSGNLERPRRDP